MTHPDALLPVLQPVIDLTTGAVAGYEALARVRAPLPQLSPAAMFAWARRHGRVDELDWACRCAAFRVALAAGVVAPMPLLVNAEPGSLDSAAPATLIADVYEARRRLRVVIELTERELADNPVRLFRVVDSMRSLGWEIAVDDVGAEPVSLAVLPLLDPDIIKLDRNLINDPTSPRHALTALAVAAEVSRTGATVIAEGVETDEQLEVARGLGARFAQGFRWGRPKPGARHDLTPTPLTHRARPSVMPPAPRSADRPVPMSTGELDTLIDVLLAAARADATGAVLAAWPSTSAADRWRRGLASTAVSCPFVGSYTTSDGSCQLVVLSPAVAATIVAEPAPGHETWNVVSCYRRADVVRAAQRVVRLVTGTGAVLSHPRTLRDARLVARG